MPVSAIADHSKQGHGCNRLDDNDAVNDQIPKRERTSEAGYGRGGGSGLELFRQDVSFHSTAVPRAEPDHA